MKKIIGVIGGCIFVAALGFAGWTLLGRNPMSFAGGSTVALQDYQGGAITGVPTQLACADLVKRGEYLTHAADCQACHTAPNGALFAGGFAFNMSFGTTYSTNITPDKQTGIGYYTDAQFLAAVLRGIRADGEKLYPAMPYTSYSSMTDDDALAIKAYLFTLAPVHAPAKEDQLSWPYNQRGLLALWDVAFNPDERFRPEHRPEPAVESRRLPC